MTAHRWSGWPGAWCLDCGAEDQGEICVSTHGVALSCIHGHPQCMEHPSRQCAEHQNGPCPEPGSRRNDPYALDRRDPNRHRRAAVRSRLRATLLEQAIKWLRGRVDYLEADVRQLERERDSLETMRDALDRALISEMAKRSLVKADLIAMTKERDALRGEQIAEPRLQLGDPAAAARLARRVARGLAGMPDDPLPWRQEMALRTLEVNRAAWLWMWKVIHALPRGTARERALDAYVLMTLNGPF